MIVELLIKFVARRFAAQIDRGSRPGAFVGAVCGGLAGLAGGWLIWSSDAAGFLGPAIMVSLGILGALGGALAGARLLLPPKPPVTSGVPSRAAFVPVRDPFARIRVTNWNVALAPMVIALFLLTLAALLGLEAWRKPESESIVVALGLLAGGAGSAVVFVRSVLWLDIGRDVIVRRALGERFDAPDQIVGWGFQSANGAFSQGAPDRPAPFLIRFADGFQFRVAVSPHLAGRIVESLVATSVAKT